MTDLPDGMPSAPLAQAGPPGVRRRRRAFGLLWLMMLASTACNVPGQIVGGGQACTEIGCQNQVMVILDGIELPGGKGVVKTRMCFDGACENQRTRFTAEGGSFGRQGSSVEVYFVEDELNATLRLPPGEYDDTTEHALTLEVKVKGAKPVTLERQVALTRSQPNGPDCEPVCWQAIIRA